MAINKLPGMFERGVVILGKELFGPHNVAVKTYGVGSILCVFAHGTTSAVAVRWMANP